MRTVPVVAAAAVSSALLVAACGGSSGGGGGTATASSGSYGSYGSGSSSQPAMVNVAKTRRAVVTTRSGALGTHLVDVRGRSLYLFEHDKGRSSTCYGACASEWPPLMTAGKAAAHGKAKASKLSTSARKGGGRQVDYNGHPLYYYAADTKAGQTSGEGLNFFGGTWYVVAPSGKKITHD